MEIGKIANILFFSNIASIVISFNLVIFILLTKFFLKVGKNFNYTFFLFVFISDFSIHSLNMVSYYSSLSCKIVANLTNFFELFILTLTLFTAYNLYAVMLDRKSKIFRSEWSYLTISLVLSTVIFIPSTISGWDICSPWYLKQHQGWIIFSIFDGVWYIFVMITSAVIFAKCLVSLYSTDLEYFYSTKLYWSILIRILISLVFIPLISSIYFIGYLLTPAYLSAGISKEGRLLVEGVPVSFQACFHLILFLVDPNFFQAFKELIHRIKHGKKKEEKLEKLPPLSHKVEWNDSNIVSTKYELETQILGISIDELKYIF